ncbi:MAG: TIGR03809 family protein [Rhodoplanes sp.]
MPREIPSAFPVETIRKWLALAERRKAHLVELYQSGRWRLYYTEADFISRLREAIREVDRWSATEHASAFAAISDLGQGRDLINERVTRSDRRFVA